MRHRSNGHEALKRVAYRQNHPYRVGALLGYAYLVERGRALRDAGVAFFDLTEVFRDHREPLYVDDCCHYNDEGYRILTRAIGRAVAAAVR